MLVKSILRNYISISFLALMIILDIINGHIIQNIANAKTGNGIHPIIVWNELTTNLAQKQKLSPPEFARAYTLVHIAIYNSILAKGDKITTTSLIPIISIAASRTLQHIFPNYSSMISLVRDKQISGYTQDVNITTKESQQADKVADDVWNNALSDNSNLLWNRQIPVGKCIWNGSHPVTPMAGSWKTYILKSGTEFQPTKPALCGSIVDIHELRQVYLASFHRSPEQISAVHYWGDKSPPAIWNTILNHYIQKNNMTIFDAAYSSAYLNVGMYDGFISCWHAKYIYWTARPFQRIANITTVITTPNFPSFPSGHSVISTVASEIMSELFPSDRVYLHSLSKQAGLSRLWAGIHFEQDIVAGMNQGLNIGKKIVEDMDKKPHPFYFSK